MLLSVRDVILVLSLYHVEILSSWNGHTRCNRRTIELSHLHRCINPSDLFDDLQSECSNNTTHCGTLSVVLAAHLF